MVKARLWYAAFSLFAIGVSTLLKKAAAPPALQLGIGINLGNVLEAPMEGQWAPPAQEYYFDDYKSAGFKYVRIPVRWDNHTMQESPYTVNATFMARVQQISGWALSRGLFAIVNSHHDDWLDDPVAFPAKLPRYQAIWQQVAEAFVGASDLLLFEMYNEPHEMTVDQLNTMVTTFHTTVRPLHPERWLLFGGLDWNAPEWIIANPTGLQLPNDNHIALEIHDYDPYHFTTPPISIDSWGTATDLSTLNQIFANVSGWARQYANDVPIVLGEYGCSIQQLNETARIAWYTAFTQAALKANYAGHSIWDDDGEFRTYNRQNRTWDEPVLRAIGL